MGVEPRISRVPSSGSPLLAIILIMILIRLYYSVDYVIENSPSMQQEIVGFR